MDNNVYLLYNNSEKAIVVDPSWDAEYILRESARYRQIGLILLTHGHFDHSLYAAQVKEKTGAQLWIHELDAPYLNRNVSKAKLEFGINYPQVIADKTFTDGEIIKWGNDEILVVHTPGHTPGGVCFLVGKILITGDTLFEGSVGRWDLTGGDGAMLFKSIKEKIMALDDDIAIYPGHGGISTIGDERKHNPYLRMSLDELGNLD